ncbi:hypothetical protein DO97_06535 [Neosynechococcus sphagnicola sy1]|uniref:Uncharacterized protein n=1 Tax=Neosynechococcus sphagnicola sy1 TaxID=1497020 RepID=A0A098TK78_9CYAN|nr:DUF6232 family protein [Neosynechococcus sphagnicola]KGF72681.1 hypothetical protein DO97_06535 [Neosynechococcus sphagnicola sy1]
MAEQVYFDGKGVRVTASQLIVDDTVYPLSKIRGVEVEVENPNRMQPLLCIFAGVLLLIVVVGIIILVIGIRWWMSQEPVYWLVVQTETGRKRVKRSRNGQAIESMKSAVLAAIRQLQIMARLIQAVKEREGVLTVPDAAAVTGLSNSDAHVLLDQCVENGFATRYTDPRSHGIIYTFTKRRSS